MMTLKSRYRAGEFHEAVEHYSAALRHNQKEAKVLSNRAATYLKLQRWLLCIQVKMMKITESINVNNYSLGWLGLR